MVRPDYGGGGIVNLMSSLGKALGWKSPYPELTLLPAAEIRNETVILFIIDGLGHDIVQAFPQSTLAKHLRGKLTSVFPSTTASAVTTFATGLAPQQHALTGWHMYLKEIGSIVTTLPFIHRPSRMALHFDPAYIFSEKPFTERIRVPSQLIIKRELMKSAYTKHHHHLSRAFAYGSMGHMFRRIRRAMAKRGKKFVYVYWPMYDALCHEHGKNSALVRKHFLSLDKHFAKFAQWIKKKDAVCIVTADHGHIDVPAEHRLWLRDYPEFAECLTLPLSGEPRAMYCYVRPGRERRFLQYVKKKLAKYCTVHKSSDLLRQGYFGTGRIHPKLLDRIGDYVLIMKEDYALRDELLGEQRALHIGTHGGLSAEEMEVPLIVMKGKDAV